MGKLRMRLAIVAIVGGLYLGPRRVPRAYTTLNGDF